MINPFVPERWVTNIKKRVEEVEMVEMVEEVEKYRDLAVRWPGSETVEYPKQGPSCT